AVVMVLAMGRSPLSFELQPDWRILGFTAGISFLTGILFGLAPALTATRVDLNPILKGAEGRTSRCDLGRPLVVLQVALSLALLVGAGLVIRTLRAVYSIDNGFERDKVLFAWVFPALNGYDHAREMGLYHELLERMNAIPGAQSATLSRYRQFVARPETRVWAQGSEKEMPTGVYYNPV